MPLLLISGGSGGNGGPPSPRDEFTLCGLGGGGGGVSWTDNDARENDPLISVGSDGRGGGVEIDGVYCVPSAGGRATTGGSFANTSLKMPRNSTRLYLCLLVNAVIGETTKRLLQKSLTHISILCPACQVWVVDSALGVDMLPGPHCHSSRGSHIYQGRFCWVGVRYPQRYGKPVCCSSKCYRQGACDA